MKEENARSKAIAAYPMKSGEGPYSYHNNSSAQREAIDVAKALVSKTIAENLDVSIPSKSFLLADLGCSVGANTIIAVENIIEAVELKYKCLNSSKIPKFQVFFNDFATNDFNMLFKSLHQDKKYYAAGVPGSFYGCLFPEASLHLVHSSFSLHWLSRVPEKVVDESSCSMNKGRIFYSNSGEEVVNAYKAQYEKDMAKFLQARAEEVVDGGLMLLNIYGIPNGIPHSESWSGRTIELLGGCLMDMARKGKVSEEKVNSFNIPIYLMCPREFEEAVEQNGDFSIEKMEILPRKNSLIPHEIATSRRAIFEEIIKEEFGEDIIEELFDMYLRKLEETDPSYLGESAEKSIVFFVLLKRKASSY